MTTEFINTNSTTKYISYPGYMCNDSNNKNIILTKSKEAPNPERINDHEKCFSNCNKEKSCTGVFITAGNICTMVNDADKTLTCKQDNSNSTYHMKPNTITPKIGKLYDKNDEKLIQKTTEKEVYTPIDYDVHTKVQNAITEKETEWGTIQVTHNYGSIKEIPYDIHLLHKVANQDFTNKEYKDKQFNLPAGSTVYTPIDTQMIDDGRLPTLYTYNSMFTDVYKKVDEPVYKKNVINEVTIDSIKTPQQLYTSLGNVRCAQFINRDGMIMNNSKDVLIQGVSSLAACGKICNDKKEACNNISWNNSRKWCRINNYNAATNSNNTHCDSDPLWTSYSKVNID